MGLGAGLVLGLRGLLGKELRSRSRGWRPAILLTFYLGLLTLGVVGFLVLITQGGGTIHPTIGTLLFSTLATGTVLLLAFITPALTAGAISGERERRTLELLLVTRASPLGLVAGKLLGSVFYIVFLLVAALPAFAVVYLFGGVPPRYLGMVLAVAAVTALGHAALGLLLSAVLRRTIVASVVAYVLVVVLVFGLPFVAAVSNVAQMASERRSGPEGSLRAAPLYVYASPVASLHSVLPGGSRGQGMPVIGDLMRFIIDGSGPGGPPMRPVPVSVTQHVVVVGFDPASGQPQYATAWAPWIYHFIFSGALTLLSLLWAALAVSPIKPWQAWRVRREQRPTGRSVGTEAGLRGAAGTGPGPS